LEHRRRNKFFGAPHPPSWTHRYCDIGVNRNAIAFHTALR